MPVLLLSVGCHGVDGNSLAPTFPKLAGQNEGYLLKQLKDFKSDS
jgi:cytochrome c553